MWQVFSNNFGWVKGGSKAILLIVLAELRWPEGMPSEAPYPYMASGVGRGLVGRRQWRRSHARWRPYCR